MTDKVPENVRSKMMSAVRGKITGPELAVRTALFAAGCSSGPPASFAGEYFTEINGSRVNVAKITQDASGYGMQWFADVKARKPKPTNTVPINPRRAMMAPTWKAVV